MIVEIITQLVFKFTKRIVGLPLIPEHYDNYISLFDIETNETRSFNSENVYKLFPRVAVTLL